MCSCREDTMRKAAFMFRLSVLAVLCLALAQLAGCVAGAVSGVSGTSLVRTGYPRLNIAVNEPLVLQGYGRQWVSLPSEFLGNLPSGTMDYAVYGEMAGGDAGGPVTRHAHAFVVRPNDDIRWRFRLESFKPYGGLSFGKQEINGYRWTVQLLRVDGETDWFSAMWRESGRETPPVWLARRFSATPEKSIRVVAEYREPWPECLDPEITELTFVRKECLEGFLARADEAFVLDMHAPETIEAPLGTAVLHRPPFSPDMGKLAGELFEDDMRFRRWR